MRREKISESIFRRSAGDTTGSGRVRRGAEMETPFTIRETFGWAGMSVFVFVDSSKTLT